MTDDPEVDAFMPFVDPPPVDDLRGAIGLDLVMLLDHAQASDDPSEVARCLAALRDFKADAATVYADVEKHLLSCMGERTLEVEGLGLFESKRRTKRTGWDHDALVDAVVDSFDDIETGDSHWAAIQAFAAELRECMGFGPGKVKGLRARGLEPDLFCQETPDGWSVALPPRDHDNDLA